MILIEVEFNNNETKKIHIDTNDKPFTSNDIIKALNLEYKWNWKNYKLLSEII